MLAEDYKTENLVHLPDIHIKTIPHNDQRYETCGDWWYNEDGSITITVSQTNSKYEFLIAVHEMVEVVLCGLKQVNEKDVTSFDLEFEKMRVEYPKLVADAEPGDNDAAPYFHEHAMASRIEHWLADSIGVDWSSYEKEINSLEKSVN